MTYKELLDMLLMAPVEHLNQTATVWVPGVNEFYPISETLVTSENDVLDEDHLIMVVK